MARKILTPEQERVLRTIRRVGQRRGATPKEVKAAVETGLVETGLRNLPGGEGDSAGWRQERASLYRDPTNLTASVNRFFDETGAVKDRYGRAGDLAAAVQRPRADLRYKYQSRSGDAQALLGGGASPSSKPGSRTISSSRTIPGVDRSQQRKALILQFLQQRGRPGAVTSLATGLDANKDTPSRTVRSTRVVKGHASSASGAKVASGHSPVTRSGKIIGTPYKGTHTLGNWQSDNADDIGVPAGTPMVAVQDGVVEKVTRHPQGSGRFAGDQITIRGANGNEYFYAHGVAHVRPGQRVRKGQKLGVTGSANGVEHLHYAQRRGNPAFHAAR